MTETSPIRMSRWKLAVALLAAVLLAASVVRWWRGTAVAVETVVRRDFVQSGPLIVSRSVRRSLVPSCASP